MEEEEEEARKGNKGTHLACEVGSMDRQQHAQPQIGSLTVQPYTHTSTTGRGAMSSGAASTAAAAAAAAPPAGPQPLEVESADVVKLMLQFCKENRLLHTMRTLQEEAQVCICVGVGVWV